MIVDKVTGVNFYPLKSAQAATIQGKAPISLPVGRCGFEVNGVRDRDFLLFDPADGCFISQRGWNAAGQLRHKTDRQLAAVRLDVRDDHTLVSSRAGSLELANAPAQGKRMTLDVFGKALPVVEQNRQASAYFSALLEREVQLVRSDREQPRILPARYRRQDAYNEVAGADGHPFLFVSEASLAAAHVQSGLQPGSVSVNRYRSNIIIAGEALGAFNEDYIDGQAPFKIGDISAWVVKACSRGPIPNYDQETGDVAGNGLRVLRGRAGRIFTGEEGVFFGQNIAHAGEGVITVGDQVVIGALALTPNIEFRNPQ